MSDFRETPTQTGAAHTGVGTEAGATAARPVPGDDGVRSGGQDRSRDDDQWEHERIGIHNEAETVRRDRIRWGPVWAGVVTAVGTYLLLQLALIAAGIVELGGSGGDDAVWSGIAALIAFFLGGLMTGATAMWQGTDDGIVHGIVMWFAALVGIIVFSAIGSGLALGSFDTADAFDDIGLDEIDVDEANDDAQDAAGRALLALALGLLASAAGGAAGAKLWPKDDAFVDVVKRKDDR